MWSMAMVILLQPSTKKQAMLRVSITASASPLMVA